MCSISGVIALKPVDPREVLGYGELMGWDLQHRGHEWAGLAHSRGEFLHVEKRAGRTSALFGDQILVDKMIADAPQMLLGHTRFSTQGTSTQINAQPHYLRPRRGIVALASNGDMHDYPLERIRLENHGSKIISQVDAELLLHDILDRANDDPSRFPEGIIGLMQNIRASYSAWLATHDQVFLFRDPYANRPIYYMKVGSYFVFASEDCALIGILLERAEIGFDDGTVEIHQVMPGEIISISLHGEIRRIQGVPRKDQLAHCAFERVYFARPDSSVFGAALGDLSLCYKVVVTRTDGEYFFNIVDDHDTEEIFDIRYRLGERLAKVCPAPDAEFVMAIPDSGTPGAIGFASASGLPYRVGLVRNSYVGRTFISPGILRRSQTAIKYRPLRGLWRKNDRGVVVDDSIVYGTSIERLARGLRTVGAKALDLRVTCPPIIAACRYGTDMKSKGTLIAAERGTVEAIERHLKVASLRYLPLDDLKAVIGQNQRHCCFACWDKDFRI